ncbi:uncharacterized protein K452DRAFT_301449 [Aplosporella prunicola CBS 121167]|uniref:DUF7730 domain-containing protein n=1 Tax=Aplosporella prunicola CBS 121167 TaxID=1176127 RepID=A0A6A6B2N1_9PEZI|nr:uncharacterized protein K452DRAFT_301449 [Aplosporella prunicola CBS 121167]KAF2138076.1 hypothetical protein K452DRAFT_301449 [Aplosporella prunicola CBS 121167]
MATMADPLPSALHRLSPDLRDRIYELVLQHSAAVWWPPSSSPAPGNAIALLTTSRTMHAEAAPVLYAANRFMFAHPSDANMFVHTTSPLYSRCITNICLRIRDRDVRLWSTYLGSTSSYRSLQHDFPRLKTLWIFFRSNFWSPRANDLFESFYRWRDDPAMREICLNLEGRVPENADIRLVCVHRVPRAHIDSLVQNVSELTVNKFGTGEARTQFRRLFGVNIALELTPADPTLAV